MSDVDFAVEDSTEAIATNSPSDQSQGVKKPRQGRGAVRPYPHVPFEEALEFASEIQRIAGSNAVRRLTLFDTLKRAPESGPSRALIVVAGKYGLINGGTKSETLQLTTDGNIATSDDVSGKPKALSRANLAILKVPPFKALYEKFVNQRLPAIPILEDAAREIGIDSDYVSECVEVFIVNLRFVGLLKTLSGADRIVNLDFFSEGLPDAAPPNTEQPSFNKAIANTNVTASTIMLEGDAANFENLCFFIGPIGEEGTEHRKHSDLILESLVRPVLEQYGFAVKRADEIHSSGLINKQIFEHLIRCKLAVADLSFHNPNVFYELAIRHAQNLPVVQLIRKSDKIPFDINQGRTIIIDTTDLYTFVPKMESYKAEISSHIRRILDDPSSSENPFRILFPN